ncbi:MAG: SpoVA/SpoVAEb family sporulation membrane protein [Clostridia bacterium]|nr:SpoVA/SpoVAEb family sporulation membrane protein [Clostridia bacterium]
MNMDKKQYKRYAASHAKRSPILKNCVRAFIVGGGICLFSEGLFSLFTLSLGLEEEVARTLCSVSLIFNAVLLTGLGVFDKIAKFAGAGTLVPITGFANSVASPAIDSRAEGYVLGVGAKIFTVCGPVLLYGTLAGAIYGVIYWICSLF